MEGVKKRSFKDAQAGDSSEWLTDLKVKHVREKERET